jgi:hypothetical protein
MRNVHRLFTIAVKAVEESIKNSMKNSDLLPALKDDTFGCKICLKLV